MWKWHGSSISPGSRIEYGLRGCNSFARIFSNLVVKIGHLRVVRGLFLPDLRRYFYQLDVIILLWAAFALRVFHLGVQSLWYDEGVTWYLTRFSLPELVHWTAADIQPPFYYFFVWFTTRLFGQTEFALRFPSVVFGVLGVAVMWQLGRTLLPRRRSAWLAVAFTAFAPLMVYYGQEARMYTLLVLQAGLSSLLVIRVVNNNNTKPIAIAYVLVMTSALYTHYFAAFLLLAHITYYAVVSISRAPKFVFRHSPFVWMFGGVAVLFAPWTPVLLARLGDDPSYWPGALKLAEVVQDVFISFAVGGKREMILEANGLPLAAGFGVLLAVSILLWLARVFNDARRKTGQSTLPSAARQHLLLLLLWLVLPIAAILLLSYRTPKFNPRYTMLAWPAFVLLLTQIAGFRFNGGVARNTQLILRIFSAIALIFIAASWIFSLHNWFFDPQFSKDDFKHVAQFIRERSRPGDTVLLSSGHFFPVWEYYFGPDNWTPLPKMETLNVNQVTDFGIAPTLKTALTGHSGAWLVTWQDEVVDPNGVVPLLLDVAGERLEDAFHAGDFWGVGLHYWRIPPTITFPVDYPADVRTDVNFGNLVTLRGFLQPPNNPTGVVLLWQARQPLAGDYLISLRLLDAQGVEWSSGVQVDRPAAYLYPTQRWLPGKIVAGRQTLPWLPGTPPGAYWVAVGWLTATGQGVDVLDSEGNPLRRTALLGPLHLAQPVGGVQVDHLTPLWEGAVDLLSAQFAADAVEAGSKVVLDSLWRANATEAQTVTLTLASWRDGAGHRFPIEPPVSIHANYTPNTTFRARPKLSTPPQAEPGLVTLWAQATGPNGRSEDFPLASLTLRPTTRNFTPPAQTDISVGATFGGRATLLGVNADTLRLSAGQSTQLTLYWRADAPFVTDYTVFVHVLGVDGTPIVIADHVPPRSTTNWLEGEIIADPVTLTLPAGLPAGKYPVEVGLYNAADPAFPRLAVDGGNANFVILGEIEIL